MTPEQHDNHAPSDPAGAPDVDTLVDKAAEAYLYVAPIHDSVVRDSRAALFDLAARARERDYKLVDSSVAADRDRLALRVAELEAALRPFVEEYDFHAADYLAQRVDGEDARVFTARTVELLIEHQRAARKVLAGDGGGA